MTSSTAETLGSEQGSVEMEIEEEDDQSHRDAIAHPFTPITQEINQIDDSSSVDSALPYDLCKKPLSSTPEVFKAYTAGEFELALEGNSIGKWSVDPQFCKASDGIGIHHYEKQDVYGSEMTSEVRANSHLDDMTDRNSLIEPVNYKLDATEIAESSNLGELTDSNKRPAIVCSFFAKGWCIKGKSCRFLHVRDGLASEGTQKSERPIDKDSMLAEDSGLGNVEILKERNEVRGLLKGGPGFNAFIGHETWPIFSGCQQMSSLSTMWKRDPSQLQKCLDSDPMYQASRTSHFQHYSFLPSGSGLQNLPNIKQPAECKTTLFGDWEPSIPFQPSHIITQRLLSNAKRCNPVHDNVEQTDTRDKVSQSGQEACGESDNVSAKAHADSVETLCRKYDSSNHFVSGSNFYIKEIQNDSYKIQSVNAEITAERQKCSLLTENESSLNSIENQSNVGVDVVDVSDSEPCTDRQSHTTQPKVDFVGRENGIGVELTSDADAHKESNELKIFHAALVERVKELLRQPWHDGLLSRDVYKLIVKKAVDKVISVMEPDQIPVSNESIKQYFFLFKGKLTKLVEAYVEKYGKSLPG